MIIVTLSRLKLFFEQIKLNFAKVQHTHTVSEIEDFSNNGIQTILQLTYPVGSVYISTSATIPSELFGFGVWEQIKDVFLLSTGDTYSSNETGGASEVKIVKRNLPYYVSSDEVMDYGLNMEAGFINRVVVERPDKESPENLKIMPPYMTVYMWKRIS